MLRRLLLWADCLHRGKGNSGRRRRKRFLVAELEPRVLMAVTIELRYELDANNFFDTQAKKNLLQLAANNIASRLNDSLSAIQPWGTNHWSAQFFNPATGILQTIGDLVVPANTLEIYVGGRVLNGAERGFGGPGGYSWTGTPSWGSTVEGRGQAGTVALIPTDTSPWGGAITFDSRTDWFFGSTTSGLKLNQTDFLSVAEHEIGHVLGVGDNPIGGPLTAWSRYVVNGAFIGPNAMASQGNTPVSLDPTGAHWANFTRSAGQEPAMTPVLTDGTRKLFTPLDFAGLADIGWSVQMSSTITFSASAYSVSEGSGVAAITISRSDAKDFASIQFDTFGGTATPGQDYQPFSANLLFGPGELSKTVHILTINDNKPEANKTVNLSLSNPVNVSLGSITHAVLTIVDDDRPHNLYSDFDGDGITDLAVYRPSQALWTIRKSSGGSIVTFMGDPSQGDIPAAGDYDGDGITDLAVYRPSQAVWIIRYSTGGTKVISMGDPSQGDIAAPGDYDGDGKTDLAVYRPSIGLWIIRQSSGGTVVTSMGDPSQGDISIPGDYDGDGKTDLAVFRPSQGRWLVRLSSGGLMNQQYGYAGLYDVPTQASFGSLIALGLLTPGHSATYASATNYAIGSRAATGFLDIAVPAPSEASAPGILAQNVDYFHRLRPRDVAKRHRLD